MCYVVGRGEFLELELECFQGGHTLGAGLGWAARETFLFRGSYCCSLTSPPMEA